METMLKESKQKRETAHNRDEHQRQKNNTGNRGKSKTSSHMPTTKESSYTPASSEETVSLKDMAYKRNQST